jgi:hypothetical protein
VHGFRYNAKVMARHLAAATLGLAVPGERVDGDPVPYLLEELTTAPERLDASPTSRRAVSAGAPPTSCRSHFVDRRGPTPCGRREMDADGATYPAVYVRRAARSRGGCCRHLLNDFRGPGTSRSSARQL